MSTKLYVGNLAFQTTSQELQELFAQADRAGSASVVEGSRGSRAFRFIELGTPEERGGRVSRTVKKDVTEVTLTVTEDKEASKQVSRYFTQIAESRERARKTQIQIGRLKKKTQAIIDTLQ